MWLGNQQGCAGRATSAACNALCGGGAPQQLPFLRLARPNFQKVETPQARLGCESLDVLTSACSVCELLYGVTDRSCAVHAAVSTIGVTSKGHAHL